MAMEGDDGLKRENAAIMKCLTGLLILSDLLIALGLLALIPCADMDLILDYMQTLLFNMIGPWMFLIILTGIPYVILLLCMMLFCMGMLMTGIGAAVYSILSAVFAVKACLKISRGDPDQQRRGKQLAAEALLMNAVDAVILLVLDLFLNFLSQGFLAPWSLYSLYLCLAGAAVLVMEPFLYRKLRLPPKEDPGGISQTVRDISIN